MEPICVKCNRPMIKTFTGVLVAELYLQNTAIYKLWYADFYRCRLCRAEIIHDFAENPFWACDEKNREGQKDFAIEEAKKKGCYFEVWEAR